MGFEGWEYYNHALIPTCAPDREPNTDFLKLKTFWDKNTWRGNKPILARWTTDWDCGVKTNFWYVIKDTPFDISELKAKRRYEVNRAIKNFDVKVIDPLLYKDDLYEVQVAAFSAYPEKYRPTVNRENFIKNLESWKKYVVFGTFSKETNKLCGYSFLLKKSETALEYLVHKVMPQYEGIGVNASLVFGVLQHYESFLANGGYISDGSRNVSHETRFQDYLQKYFLFRKAYCKLNIRYRRPLKLFIGLIYPFRRLLRKFDNISIVHNINAILMMEWIVRNPEKDE